MMKQSIEPKPPHTMDQTKLDWKEEELGNCRIRPRPQEQPLHRKGLNSCSSNSNVPANTIPPASSASKLPSWVPEFISTDWKPGASKSTKTAGVYFNNVELKDLMHPLQRVNDYSAAAFETASLTAKKVETKLAVGRPLLPAPQLPCSVIRDDDPSLGRVVAVSRPLTSRCYERDEIPSKASGNIAKRRSPVPTSVLEAEGGKKASRRAMTTEEKLFVEAAAALSAKKRSPPSSNIQVQ